LLRFDVVCDSFFGFDLYQFSFTDREVLSNDGPGSISTQHFDLWRPARTDLTIDKIRWMDSADHFIVVWNQLFDADPRTRRIYAQLVLRSDETGAFGTQPLVELISADLNTSVLCRLLFDPFCGRACALLIDARIVIIDYLEGPNMNDTRIPILV
jgi:hypothetical protein